MPEDYIHRVGRTARAELTGSAFTLVAPEDEASIRDIERAINKRLPRVTVPDFDYTARSEQRLEVPHAQRIAEIRARKAEERQRAKANADRRARHARGSQGRVNRRQGHGTRRPAAGKGAPAASATAASTGAGLSWQWSVRRLSSRCNRQSDESNLTMLTSHYLSSMTISRLAPASRP